MSSPVSTGWQPLAGPLAAAALGPHTAHRVVFVHGFTQTGTSWRPIAGQVARDGHRVIVVDLPGHGDSAGVRADLRRTADMVAQVGGRATYVGYSLGGRVCLHLALMYPHLVESLVLVGANPGIADADERALRRASDDVLAAHLLEAGVPAFLEEWARQPLFGGFDPGEADRADRLRNTAEGLAASLRMAGTGEQASLWPRLRELNMPVLAIAGERDEKYLALARQLADEVPTGRWLAIAGAAHAAHLEQPEAVTRAILSALPL